MLILPQNIVQIRLHIISTIVWEYKLHHLSSQIRWKAAKQRLTTKEHFIQKHFQKSEAE